MLSIHNNPSAGVQNVVGVYILIMLVYRCLLTTRLHGKAATVRGKILEWEKIGEFGELWSLRQYFTRQ